MRSSNIDHACKVKLTKVVIIYLLGVYTNKQRAHCMNFLYVINVTLIMVALALCMLISY